MCRVLVEGEKRKALMQLHNEASKGANRLRTAMLEIKGPNIYNRSIGLEVY